MPDIYKAAGILIKNRKLLVEKSKNKDFFIAPGGKIEIGETEKDALVRELFEEFRIKVLKKDLEEFGEFHAAAAGQEEDLVHMRCYLVKTWKGEPKPNNEVEKLMWITTNDLGGIRVGSIFEHEVVPRLKQCNLID